MLSLLKSFTFSVLFLRVCFDWWWSDHSYLLFQTRNCASLPNNFKIILHNLLCSIHFSSFFFLLLALFFLGTKVNGGWSGWSAWSGCAAGICAGNQRIRTRTCTNPIPSEDGAYCEGDNAEQLDCKSKFSVDTWGDNGLNWSEVLFIEVLY